MQRFVVGLVLAWLLTPGVVSAQEAPVPSAEGLMVFFDCNAFMFCDFDHTRREIPFVNWVRDRQDADVHVLITQQQTGGGGWEMTLAFIGLGDHMGKEDTLLYVSDPTDTRAEVRDGLTQTLRLGLVRFVAPTAIGPRLQITYRPPQLAADAPALGTEVHDPWDYWTFRIGANGSMSGEQLQSGYSVSGNASANRTTEDLKVSIGTYGRYSKNEWELSDGSIYENIQESYSASVLAVWSLGDHWSFGATADADRSTQRNLDFGTSAGPALEYNIFPYDESTRKAITFLYTAELATFNYEDSTVNGKLSEVLPRHRLSIGASVTQPWGNVYGSAGATQYLHDLAVHRIDTFAGFRIRLFRGLEFNASGNFSRIKDQFYLPAEGLTDEEILTRRRARETDYRFRFSMGFSFRFGSKFANVVNPRMGGGGGGMMIIF